MWKVQVSLSLAFAGLVFFTGCMKPAPETSSPNNSASSTGSYLYVASGACYSGAGNTTYTNIQASNLVYRINPDNGMKDMQIADYWSSPSVYGDTPVGLGTVQNDLVVLVENTTTPASRRIERIGKTAAGPRSAYSSNATAFTPTAGHILRGMTQLSDGYFLVSKSIAVEKVKDGANRLGVVVGGTTYPWLNLANPPATSSCITNTTLVSSTVVLNNGNIVFSHAGTAMNRIGLISSSGYGATANCLNGNAIVAAPTALAFPTAMAYDGVSNKLIVAYAGSSTAADVNSIYVYPVNETANTIGTGVKIYDANAFGANPGWNFLLYGISAMTYEPSTNSLYVASAINTNIAVSGYKIEKLVFNAANIGVNNNAVLSRNGSAPFYDYGSDTKCISSLMIAN